MTRLQCRCRFESTNDLIQT